MKKPTQTKIPLLENIASEKTARIAEFKKRKKRLLQIRVPEEKVDQLLQRDWQIVRSLRGGISLLEKQKGHDEQYEDRLWCVMYQFGAVELSEGRKVSIPTKTMDGENTEYVDILAKLDDVVIVTRCKSLPSKQKRSVDKDIEKFASAKGAIAKTLQKHYGEAKLKLIWLFATRNIVLSKEDKARADQLRIHILEERELRYFENVAKNVGSAAKYQFLGEFLANQSIPALENCIVPAIKTKLGGQAAYFFLAPAHRLLPIAFVNHRGLRDPDGAPAYQRVLKKSRLKEIGSYLDEGGFFPNCIITNFRSNVRFDKQSSFEDRHIVFGQLYLPDTFKSLWVIDGQHRLYGYTEVEESSKEHIIPILAFEKLATVKEAELFTTINSKQQKVAPGLLDELAGELKLGSEDFHERSSGIIARALDLMSSETGNPFEDRIKSADLSETETAALTISEVKKGINAAKLLGTEAKDGTIYSGPFTREDAEDAVHALCEGLTAYFQLIEGANQDRWLSGRAGYLCSNTAVQGYLRLLAALCDLIREKAKIELNALEPEELIQKVKPYLKPVLNVVATADDAEFERRFKQPFGSGGPPRYYAELCRLVRTEFPDFNPPGLEQLLTEQNAEVAAHGDWLAKTIVDRLHGHVIRILKQTYKDDYFDKGISSRKIKKSAYDKRFDDDNPMPPENYLDVISLKEIVETSQNWDLFKETLSIRLPGENKGNAKHLGWIAKLNEVRRVNAHPYGRKYSDEDIQFLELINEQLESNNV